MKRRFCILLSLLCLLCLSTRVWAGTLPLSEVKVGMQGYGRTVFLGTTIESFPVEVLAVLPQDFGHHFILVRAGGPQIEKIGGIASGMSGSPVYLEGKLVGAISRGWSYSDHRLAMITPIEEMMALWTDGRTTPLPIELTHDDYLSAFKAVNSPLYSFGLGGRALHLLKDAFQSYGIELLNGSSGLASTRFNPSVQANDKLEPGSALAVDIMRGDMGLSFVGTVTEVSPKGILAFGHPLFNFGNVEYFMSSAYVHQIIPSSEFPFKLASSMNALGRISQDRGAGVTGSLGQFPSMIPLNITVKDLERNIQRKCSLQLVKLEQLLGDMVGAGILQLLDDTLDRVGQGMAKVDFEIAGRGLPNMKLSRDNYFYSGRDIAGACLEEIYYIMYLLMENPFQDCDIYNISVSIEIENRNNTAFIQDVQLAKTKVKAGEEIEATVILRPFRKAAVKKKVTIKVPETMPSGGATLMIFGGPSYYKPEAEDNEQDFYDELYCEDLKVLLDNILLRAKNNQMTIEVYPYYYPEEDKDNNSKDEFEIRELIDTEYIIDGFWSKEIEIEED